MTDDISDRELIKLVVDTDSELFKAGVDIKQRQLRVIDTILTKLGYVMLEKLGHLAFMGLGPLEPPVIKRINAAYRELYRPRDLAMGGHIGVYMYRDIFARVSVPHVYGQVSINPFDYVELTELQKRVMGNEPGEIEQFLDQFSDIADIQYGTNELKPEYAKLELVNRFINFSRLHLHAAAAVVTGGYDFRGAIQSSLLATELALKAGAATRGLTEQQIKDRFGHDFPALIDFVGSAWPQFDADRVQRVVAKQPKYVPNRYSKAQPDRCEVGHIVMGAQYVASEVVRHLSERNFRAGSRTPHTRRYPA
jgi:hypothetical protein